MPSSVPQMFGYKTVEISCKYPYKAQMNPFATIELVRFWREHSRFGNREGSKAITTRMRAKTRMFREVSRELTCMEVAAVRQHSWFLLDPRLLE